jgi:hypothetical protein
MKHFRSVLVGFVVVACFFLSGFKKPNHHHESSIKKHQLVNAAKHQQKPLDLTVPISGIRLQAEPEALTLVQQSTAQGELTTGNKNRAIELKGNVIMSQEPEAGKIKSADGAGIMINLHP